MPKNSTPPVLYHYYRSSCSWRVRWAFNIKGLSYQAVAVNLLTGEQNSPEFLKKNPSGQVPCLQMQDQLFGESMAILEWLEETHPSPPLLPTDPLSRMRVRQLCYTIAAGTQPLQNLKAQRFYSEDKDKQLRYAQHWIHLGLSAYEKILADSRCSGSFSFGGELTLADLCLIPQCYNAVRFGVDLQNFPRIRAIYERCLATKHCQAAAPEKFEPAAK